MTVISAADFVQVRQTLAGQAAAAKAALKGRPVFGDFAAETAPSRIGKATPPLTYHLTYRDADDVITQRIITLQRLDPDRSGMKLICWCHGAQANRCFAISGIVEVFDVTTGEVHTDPEIFFATHPLLTDPNDPEAYALKVCKHEVNVLVTIGAADGRFDPDEQDKVLVHIFDRLPDTAMNEDVLRARLCLFTPDLTAFNAALHQMARFRRGDPTMLMRTMRKLVEADGRITPEEHIFVLEVNRHLAEQY